MFDWINKTMEGRNGCNNLIATVKALEVFESRRSICEIYADLSRIAITWANVLNGEADDSPYNTSFPWISAAVMYRENVNENTFSSFFVSNMIRHSQTVVRYLAGEADMQEIISLREFLRLNSDVATRISIKKNLWVATYCLACGRDETEYSESMIADAIDEILSLSIFDEEEYKKSRMKRLCPSIVIDTIPDDIFINIDVPFLNAKWLHSLTSDLAIRIVKMLLEEAEQHMKTGCCIKAIDFYSLGHFLLPKNNQMHFIAAGMLQNAINYPQNDYMSINYTINKDCVLQPNIIMSFEASAVYNKYNM